MHLDEPVFDSADVSQCFLRILSSYQNKTRRNFRPRYFVSAPNLRTRDISESRVIRRLRKSAPVILSAFRSPLRTNRTHVPSATSDAIRSCCWRCVLSPFEMRCPLFESSWHCLANTGCSDVRHHVRFELRFLIKLRLPPAPIPSRKIKLRRRSDLRVVRIFEKFFSRAASRVEHQRQENAGRNKPRVPLHSIRFEHRTP